MGDDRVATAEATEDRSQPTLVAFLRCLHISLQWNRTISDGGRDLPVQPSRPKVSSFLLLSPLESSSSFDL